jgi:hypothetical protein
MDITADVGAARALVLTRILRATILVVCLATAGAAWMLGSPTVMGLALVIAAEETWETSVVVAALRRQLRGEPFPDRGYGRFAPRRGMPILGHRS